MIFLIIRLTHVMDSYVVEIMRDTQARGTHYFMMLVDYVNYNSADYIYSDKKLKSTNIILYFLIFSYWQRNECIYDLFF